MYIFYCADGNFGEVAGVFFAEKHSPDALRVGTGRWLLASGVLSGVAECTGRTGVSPVLSVRYTGCLAQLGLGTGRQAPDADWSVRCSESGVRAVLQTSLDMSPVSTGRSGAQRPVTPRVCMPP